MFFISVTSFLRFSGTSANASVYHKTSPRSTKPHSQPSFLAFYPPLELERPETLKSFQSACPLFDDHGEEFGDKQMERILNAE